jgi:hypothetical protein
MGGFEDSPLVSPGSGLHFTSDGRAVPHDDALARPPVRAREAQAGAQKCPVNGERDTQGVSMNKSDLVQQVAGRAGL